MKKLTGTEKQIVWANDIRAELVRVITAEIDKTDEKVSKHPRIAERLREEARVSERALTWLLDNATSASWWIDNRAKGYGKYDHLKYPVLRWLDIRKLFIRMTDDEIEDFLVEVNGITPYLTGLKRKEEI